MDVNVKGNKGSIYKQYRVTMSSGTSFEVTATRFSGAHALADMQCGIYQEVVGIVRLPVLVSK